MTEFERKLSSFAPAAVDRDAMLFAAGRSSAPSPRWWKRACGLLVVTQLVTLGVWLGGERRGSTPPSKPSPRPVTPAEPPPSSPPDPASYLVLLRTWDETRPPSQPSGGVEPHRTAPLTAGSRDFY